MEKSELCTNNTVKIAVLENTVSDIKSDVSAISTDMKEVKRMIEKFILNSSSKIEKIPDLEQKVSDLKSFKTSIIWTCGFIATATPVLFEIAKKVFG